MPSTFAEVQQQLSSAGHFIAQKRIAGNLRLGAQVAPSAAAPTPLKPAAAAIVAPKQSLRPSAAAKAQASEAAMQQLQDELEGFPPRIEDPCDHSRCLVVLEKVVSFSLASQKVETVLFLY